MFRLAASSLFNCKKFSDSAFCTSITQEGSCPSFNPCFRRKLNSKKFAHFYLQKFLESRGNALAILQAGNGVICA